MTSFAEYSEFYDMFYTEKDYPGEFRYVRDLLLQNGVSRRDLLEIGCGTGKHGLFFLNDGWKFAGIDLSRDMLKAAEVRFRQAGKDSGVDFSLFEGDARSFQIKKKFSAAISLFHVMSYQSGPGDFQKAMRVAGDHLEPNGLFLFDFWYGPAVLTQGVETRYRRVEDEINIVHRFATSHLLENENVVEVRYEFLAQQKLSNRLTEFFEIHRMRYLFLPEISSIAAVEGFIVVGFFEWMFQRSPSKATWNVCALLRRNP